MRKTYIKKGTFYKGNLHSHSTLSDGKMTPIEMATAYIEKGYNFLMISDHNINTSFREFDNDTFITLDGFEGNIISAPNDFREMHFLFLPHNVINPFKHLEKVESPSFKTINDVNEYIKRITSRGYISILSHPHWSTVEYDDIIALKGIIGLECYNNCTKMSWNMGESITHWDSCLRRGKRLWGFAVDDTHNQKPIDSVYCDLFGGFIMVRANELSRESITDAIVNGDFYSSQGPEIYELYIEDNIVYLKCSPVDKVYMRGNIRQKTKLIAKDSLITEFQAELMGTETYVRIELFDSEGKKAYTNPIYLD